MAMGPKSPTLYRATKNSPVLLVEQGTRSENFYAIKIGHDRIVERMHLAPGYGSACMTTT